MFLYIVTSTRHSVDKKKSPLERHSAHFLRGKEGEVRLSNFIFGFVFLFVLFSKIKLKICGTINMMNTIA